MSELDDKVNYWDHEWLQEQVWELQREHSKLREEIDLLKKQIDSLNDSRT